MAAWGLSALTAALEAGLWDQLEVPATADMVGERTRMSREVAQALLDVLVALELVRREGERYALQPELEAAVTGSGKEALLAELRSNSMQARDLVERARVGTVSAGWTYSDPQILQAQGTRSAVAVTAWAKFAFSHSRGPRETSQSVWGSLSRRGCRRRRDRNCDVPTLPSSARGWD